MTLEPSPCAPTDPSPAAQAGIKPGDKILSVGGTKTPEWADAVAAIREQTGRTPFVLERDGQEITVQVDVMSVQRAAVDAARNDPDTRLETVGAIGLGPTRPVLQQYNPITAIPATFAFTGTMFEATWDGLLMFPEKVPAVLKALTGVDDDNRPVSVVGAATLGGDAVDQGQWAFFLLLLAVLNFFIGVFNLLPLLPLDGGHVVVNLYERVRDSVRQRLGKSKMPPVDYTRLLPVTYVVIVVLGGVSLLTVAADIVNPIRLAP
jgi:membrane-associated protease RseP (regulator of RpoE activity)